MTDQEYEELKAKLRPRLTDEFLATLDDAARLTMFDDFEIDGFVHELYQLAGKERPSTVGSKYR